MPLLNSLINLFYNKRLEKIDVFRQKPEEVQAETLQDLLQIAKNTEWGKRYDFSSINNAKTFAERVPVQNYDTLKADIDRTRKGEENILWPSPIRWFAKSSGTTSDVSKFIPVSREALDDCHYRGGKDIIAFFAAQRPESNIFSGKGLTLGGTYHGSSDVSYYGDLSAILIENAPYWTNFIRTPKADVALIDDWETKLAEITKVALQTNVTSFLGVPSWNLVLIKNILKESGASNLLEVWPNLELFIHGGVSFTPYKKQYQELIPSDNMTYLETYNASEGFFAIQDDLTDDSLLLMLDYGIFYEFMPLDELGKELPKTYTIGEVEKDKNYAIIITTNAGLWRYMIGDTITFTSLYPHKIKITGRTKLFINAFGEEVIIDNAENALKVACDATKAIVKEYTAAPVFMGNNEQGTHEWVIEFEQEPTDFDEFCKILDKELQAVNSDYAAKRYKDITLRYPTFHKARHGLFYDWMASRNKLGGQNKVPRLSNERKFVEELVKLNNENT
ncbi:GH3 auxin-responsive promoter [Balneicella halophila]|uniref:GH3 auxin-responsive promoter n=1 Tax=Balneicella halophila TaxID=1537566 RepID=A0A7L4UR99_BALHA|nr:GH3 auxin-responsive promoter family protein [Balneicella halophila]PVX52189.1 GH3 auxin-responsive promoter [Balneicella halophila]